MTEREFEQLCGVVRDAGNLLTGSIADKKIQTKPGSANYVTMYDSMVQKYLVEHLSRLFPAASFLGEEDGLSAAEIGSGDTFILDPIDGTTNFICDFMCSGICVGLAHNGAMEAGVVYNPFRGEFFSALSGHGSFLNGHPLHVSDRPLRAGVINMDIAPYNPELRRFAFSTAEALSYHCMDIRSIGSAALGICYVACNRCAAHFSPLIRTWDFAAASLVLTEAGGVFTDLAGNTFSLRAKTSFLASCHTGLQEILSLLPPLPDALP